MKLFLISLIIIFLTHPTTFSQPDHNTNIPTPQESTSKCSINNNNDINHDDDDEKCFNPPSKTINDKGDKIHLYFCERSVYFGKLIEYINDSRIEFVDHISDSHISWLRSYSLFSKLHNYDKENEDEFEEVNEDLNFVYFNHIFEEIILAKKAVILKVFKGTELVGKNIIYDERGEVFDHKNFFPESYDLCNDEEEKKAFVKSMRNKIKKYGGKYEFIAKETWMLKPSLLSGGEGIKVLHGLDLLRLIDDIEDGTVIPLNMGTFHSKEYMAQRYITNPILLDGRKVSLRQYWLIASVIPLRVLVYDEGTTASASKPYVMGDFNNKVVHITNSHQQKKALGQVIDKLNITSFWEYSYSKGKVKKNWKEKFQEKVKKILAWISRIYIKNIEMFFDEGPLPFFAFFAADFIYTDDGELWLTEVQKGPGLSFDDPVKKKLLPKLLHEMIYIIDEIRRHDMREDGKPLKELKSRKNFLWVINDA